MCHLFNNFNIFGVSGWELVNILYERETGLSRNNYRNLDTELRYSLFNRKIMLEKLAVDRSKVNEFKNVPENTAGKSSHSHGRQALKEKNLEEEVFLFDVFLWVSQYS